VLRDLLTAALGSSLGAKNVLTGSLSQKLEQELERLSAGGYLSREDLDRVRAEASQHVEAAAGTVGVGLDGLASSLRQVLDLPSRSEILALTEELRLAREAREASGGGAAPGASAEGTSSEPSS
jgi:hypothetical protein